MYNPSFYKAGGSLAWNDTTYVTRQADDDLYTKARQQCFCHVLGPHQTGKSSLRIRVRRRLKANGYRCATVQATQLNAAQPDGSVFEGWDKPLIASIWDSLHPCDTATIAAWLEATAKLPSWRRLEHFTRDLLFPELLEKPMVIFIDEIDYFLGLPLAIRDLFSWIKKSCSLQTNRREYKSLSFVVLGSTTVASLEQAALSAEQAELARPKRKDQMSLHQLFSAAGAVHLDDFDLPQTLPLQRGLVDGLNPVAALSAVLRWTGGQPFLTQKLCKILAEQTVPDIPLHSPATLNRWIDTLVKAHVLQHWQHCDDPVHLRDIRDRLYRSPNSPALRQLYQQLATRGPVFYSDTWVQNELLMIGIIRRRHQHLHIANKIYRHVFSSLLMSTSSTPRTFSAGANRLSLSPHPFKKKFRRRPYRQQISGLQALSPKILSLSNLNFCHLVQP